MTLLMATGLTFGTIAALFGLTNGHIDQARYPILVTTVILSAVVATFIATKFFEPRAIGELETAEIQAAEGIDGDGVGRRRPIHIGDSAGGSREVEPA